MTAWGCLMDADKRATGPTAALHALSRERFPARSIPVTVLATLAIFYTLYFAFEIVLPFVLAIVLNLLLAPLVRLLARRAGLPRALRFRNWLWGIPGAFLSVPRLAVTKIVCDHIENLTPIGHLLGGPSASRRRVEATERPAGV